MATIRLTPAQTRKFLQEISSVVSGKGKTRTPITKKAHKLFWAGFSHRFFELTEKRFKEFSQGKGDWKPLRPSTIARKGHNKILIDSGRLFKSLSAGRLTSSGYKKKPEQIASIEEAEVILGSAVPYAAKQHETRPLFPEERELIKKCIEAGIKHVVSAIRR